MNTTDVKEVNAAACDGAANGAPEAGNALPPITNRGVTMTVDYLSITAHTNLADLAMKALTELLGYELREDADWSEYFFNRNIGARGYAALFSGPENITVYAYPYEGRHTHIELKGKSLEYISYDGLVRFINCLEESGVKWRATRIDIAFDHVPFTPALCKEFYDLGCFRTKANRNSGDWRSNKQGDTFYLGSRSSGRYLRVYDRRGFTRCEIQYKDDYAEELARSIPDQYQLKQLSLGYLRGFVEFTIEPVEGKNSSRAKVCGWWEYLVGNAEKISLEKTKKPEKFLYEKTLRYFERMLPTLCVFSFGLGIDLNQAVLCKHAQLDSKYKVRIARLQEKLSTEGANYK